jgi:hypothetical protein
MYQVTLTEDESERLADILTNTAESGKGKVRRVPSESDVRFAERYVNLLRDVAGMRPTNPSDPYGLGTAD